MSPKRPHHAEAQIVARGCCRRHQGEELNCNLMIQQSRVDGNEEPLIALRQPKPQGVSFSMVMVFGSFPAPGGSFPRFKGTQVHRIAVDLSLNISHKRGCGCWD